MSKYYYIIDEDGDVFKTTDAREARRAAIDTTAIAVDPSRNEVWIDNDTLEIGDYEPPQEDDEGDEDDDEDSDD